MQLARKMLRKAMRNDAVTRGFGVILLALVSPACADIAGLRAPGPDEPSTGGSTNSDKPVPADETLRPAPPSNCGDVASSATNCGFCGHSCRDDACSGGLCAANVVVEATSIESFVTDGVDLFMIEPNAVRSCKAAGPSQQTCSELIVGSEIGPVLYPDTGSSGTGGGEEEEGGGWGGWGNWGGNNNGSPPKKGIEPVWIPLQPKAIARQAGGNVLIADDAYHVVISCPAQGPCNRNNVGLIDARMNSLADTKPFGTSLSVAPTELAWTQGDAIRAAAIPTQTTRVVNQIVERNETDTRATARIMMPAASDVFWLSGEGLHHAANVNATPTSLFAPAGATDFSLDANSVYVASPLGIFRIARSNHTPSIAAVGPFEKVAVQDRLYATRDVAGAPNRQTELVEIRSNAILSLAITNGPITALTIAGDYVYFATRTATGAQIKRVAR